MRLRFLGAAGTVTGSRTLVSTEHTAVLLDCGMFQGFKALRLRNWEPLPFDPEILDAVVLTHAHLDHSGWLPVLVRQGWRGPVLCTEATRDLCRLILMDSARLHEEDAAYANRKGFSRHSPAMPLFTEQDAKDSLDLFEPIRWDEERPIGDDLTLSLRAAGHILGASSALLASDRAKVLFSGDLGRDHDVLMLPPAPPQEADVVVQECTYGRRVHEDEDPVGQLGEVIARVAARRGVVLVPAFSVGRSQALMRAIQMLKQQGVIPAGLPVLVDSPMAVDATGLYERYSHEHLLQPEDGASMWHGVELVRQRMASKAIARRHPPYVLISAAGMLTGGRVLHHLARIAPRGPNALVFVGYQAAGTRGARILAGERTVRLHGLQVPIGCEIVDIDGFSAHADQDELLGWLRRLPRPPRQVVLNHGEADSADAYRVRVEEELGWDCTVARDGEEIDVLALLEGRPATQAAVPKPRPEALLTTEVRLRRVLASPTYLRADQDTAFLDRPDLTSVRLMLEYMKVDAILRERGIDDTLVVWGGTRIVAQPEAEARLLRARKELEDDPEAADAIAAVQTAERQAGLSHFYDEARKLARLACSEPLPDGRTLTVVTGGGPGIMEAANRGAFECGASTVGLNVTLPREQVPNPFVTADLALQFRYFALRKMHFLERARALVVFPGGFGTLDELATALCLMQTGKMDVTPIVLMGREFWGRVLDTAFLAEQGLVDADDLDLLRYADSAGEAWEIVRAFWGQGQKTVAR